MPSIKECLEDCYSMVEYEEHVILPRLKLLIERTGDTKLKRILKVLYNDTVRHTLELENLILTLDKKRLTEYEDIMKKLEEHVDIEKTAREQYDHIMKDMDDENIRKRLAVLRKDEDNHVKMLEKALKLLEEGEHALYEI